MTREEIQKTSLYYNICDAVTEVINNNTGSIIAGIMPLFENFINERLTQFEEFKALREKSITPTIIIKSDVQQAISYTIDYCQRKGANVTTEEVWREWCKDIEEVNS